MGSPFIPSNVSNVQVPASGILLDSFNRTDPSRGNRTDEQINLVDDEIFRGDRGSDGSSNVPPGTEPIDSSSLIPDVDKSGGKQKPDNSVINPWVPDSSATPDGNLASLADWFSNLFKFSSNYSYAGIQDPSFYANLFQLAASSLSRFNQI